MPNLGPTPDAAPARPAWQLRQQAADTLLADVAALHPFDDRHPSVIALGGLDATLAYLYERWVTRFGVLLEDDLDGPVAVAAGRTWEHLAAREPALARILSDHR